MLFEDVSHQLASISTFLCHDSVILTASQMDMQR